MEQRGYVLLDIGGNKRLEQWGPYRLVRPDPTAEGTASLPEMEWAAADAVFVGEKAQGIWEKRSDMPDAWTIDMDDLRFRIELTPYKHAGLFPEQKENWDWMRAAAKQTNRSLNILNLFAYTGGATVALAKDGHRVTHVDASKPTVAWAKDNAALNDIPDDRIRWIVDDAMTFVTREEKRGNTYDAILLDPPAYGHGPDGKAWRVERHLAPLLDACARLLCDTPVFLLVNGYAKNQESKTLASLVTHALANQAHMENPDVEHGELMLRISGGRSLSTGIFSRWHA